MKRTIERITRTAMLAVAFMLCTTTSAWAVKPKAVWWGDLSNGSSRGGFTIDINNGSATENLNTAVNGVVTIGSGSNGGVRFMRTTASGYMLSVMARVNPGANPDLSSTPVLYSLRNTYSTSKDVIGVGFGSDGKMYATWTKANNGGSSSAISFADAFSYTASRFWCAASKDATATHGTYGYWGGTEQVHNLACRSDAQPMYGVTIGGTYEANADNISGAKIDYVVIFDDATGDVVADINNFSVSGMTTVGTDLGAATAATGVNLPASATLSAAVTPAAVFVQQTSTLTMTGSASLTVKGGTGPLYVADGTTLTIDATGIDVTGVSAGDTVNLVSGKIYGTDLITVKAPAKSGLTITAAITDTGITLTAEACTVSFTSPFDGTTLAAPTTGTGWYTTQASASFGNKTAYHQTINAKSAIVAKVTGGEYSTALNGFLATGEAADNATMDVYLDVAGGSGRSVCGVQRCAWQGAPFTAATTGDAIVQIEGGTYQYVFGAGEQGAYNNSVATVTGNTGVTIKGSGKVSGSVFGGWSSSHNKTPSVSGNTAVRIENVQDVDTASSLNYIGKGFIVGGSTFQANSSSPTSVGGNSSVTVALGNSASGTFAKKIVGGSLIPEITDTGKGGGAQAVTGNASVSITAPSEVTFSQLIVGGGYNGHQGSIGSVTVGGNSSVTLSGGTYTGRIVAGSYANVNGTASVAGTATLTLNSGTFTGATLDGGNATGAKTLVVGDNLDISGATVTGFTAVTLGDGATARMTVGEEGSVTLGDGATLILDVTDEAVAYGHTATVVSKGAGASIKYYENGVEITDSSRLDGDNLNASAPIWSPAAVDASGNLADTARWSTGLLPENDTAVVKIVVNGSNTLTVNETRAFGHLYVEGSGTLLLEGDGTHHLTVGNLNIASGVTVTINDADDPLYVTDGTIDGSGTLTLANDANLTLDGVTKKSSVSLTVPSGTTLTIGGDGTTTLPLGDRVIAGNIVIEDGATLVSTTNDAPDYDHACNVYIYGTLTLNARWSMNANNKIYCYTGATINGTGDSDAALDLLNQNTTIYVNPNPDTQAAGTVTCSARIRLRGNATVNVAEGMTFLMTGNTIKQNDNCGYTKTGAGLLHIKGSFTPGGTTTVSAGKILFEDVNFNTEANPGALAGTGTVEFKGSTDHRYFYGDATGFSGKFIVTKANNSNDVLFHGTASQFSSANPPEFEVSGGVVLTGKYDNRILPVKDFSGAGNISAAFGTVSSHVNRTIDTLQTKNTAFAGTFTYADNKNSSYHRNTALTVRGADNAESVCALTLSGVSTTYGPLMITNNAKVVFTSDGSWLNGSTTVKSGGVLESQRDAQVVGALTLEAGSTLAYGDDSQTIKTSGALTLPISGKVTVDVGDLTIAGNASKELLKVGSGEMGINNFTQVGNTATHMLSVSEQTLSLIPVAATLTLAGAVTPYETVDLAVDSLTQVLADSSTSDAFVTLVNGTASELTYTADKLAEYGIIYDEASRTYGCAVAQIGSSSYPSLAAAFAAADASGDTVTLLQDITAVNIPLNDKSITFAENGKSFTGTLTGNGTIIVSSAPSTTTWAAARFADGWTGEFVCGWDHSSGDFVAKIYGTANSTVTLTSMTRGQFSYDGQETGNYCGTVKIAGSVTTSDGYGNQTTWNWQNMTTFNKLILAEGGALNLVWNTGSEGVGFQVNTLYPRGGTITLANNGKTHLKIGSVNLTAEPALDTRIVQITPQGSHVYNSEPLENGLIGVTVTANDATTESSKKLYFDTDGLYVAAASAVVGGNTKYFKTATAAVEGADADGTITVLVNTDTVTVNPGQSVVVSDGVTVGTISWGDEYVTVTSVTGDGTTSYASTAKATTYYWKGPTGSAWATVGNWAVGAADGPTATRAVTSSDSVVFNNGASVLCSAASVSCKGMTINGNVTLAGANGKDINLGGNITGSGVLTLNDACLKNSLAETITVTNTVEVLFTSDSEIAASQSVGIRFNGPVSISGTIKTWDAVHTVAGTTTLNGDFTKAGGNFGLTLGDVVVSASTRLTISAGTLTINGTVNVSDDATFTIPASGLTLGNSASFVLAGRSSLLVDNGGGASGKVSTSLTDGAKVISSTTDGVTTYKVVYGTIFSVW